MTRVQGKSARMLQVEQFLLAQDEPVSQAEIARVCGVNRSTINRMLADLEEIGIPIFQDEKGHIGINRDAYLTSIRLNLDESMAVFLAARLLARHSDKPNPHTVQALLKLGLALEQGIGPQIGKHIVRTSEALRGEHFRVAQNYLKNVETLTRAWSLNRKVRLIYRPLHSRRPLENIFAPFFLEPSAIGYGTYAIGLAEPPGKIRTRKVERIESISLTNEPFQIPADFDPMKLLSGAWGIWFDEGDRPTRVVLRFNSAVARRVRESRWHPSEQVEEDSATGDLIWGAEIDEPQEILPWVRGWGADVQVLEPKELRDALAQEARRLARLYNVVPEEPSSPTERVLRCWGKTGNSTDQYHPAVFHMLDVGNVARELLGEHASPRWRRVLAHALNADADALASWLPWFVAMHDIGKISAAFQGLNEDQKKRMQAEGFSFGRWHWNQDLHHTAISQVFVADELLQVDGVALPGVLKRVCREMAQAHHGQFASPEVLRQARSRLKADEPGEWSALRLAAAQMLQPLLLRQIPFELRMPPNISTAIMALTGFTILCDWLGSDGFAFPPRPYIDLKSYAEESEKRARDQVKTAGFSQPSTSLAGVHFSALFQDLKQARPLQRSIDEIPDEILAEPCLAIIEAPTGEGKTEAALALAHRIAQANGADDLYYALPTMATSNQMFRRVEEHLHRRLRIDAKAKLVHGQAYLVEDDLHIDPLRNADNDRAPYDWFAPKKRALLAPFGVGTIDQAELAALNVRHTALRMIGLAGKVLIVDEVHAYDTYMTTVIERLLNWLAAMDTSVILLSATLPQSRRLNLARAYGVEIGPSEDAPTAYPSLWVMSRAGAHHASPPAEQGQRQLELNTLSLGSDCQAQARWLMEKVIEGGSACWIVNTVERAQGIFRALNEMAPADMDLMLLHSRFPLDERQRLEEKLAQRYGPRGQRPARGIVVGTQVLEQSLDLDFDLMVSDLAPVDLILQRAGRLHRHTRERPTAHSTPRLWISPELDGTGRLALNRADKAVYDEFLLWQTWSVLNGRKHINLPADYRVLVESVYDAPEPAPDSPLREVWQHLLDKEIDATGKAEARLLPAPNPDDPFCGAASRLIFEENEDGASWVIAQTRLGEESVTVIPLEREGESAWFLSDGNRVEVEIGHAAARDIQLQLMQHSLRVSNRLVVQAFKEQMPSIPLMFTESPLLKNAVPLWLTDGCARLCAGKRSLVLRLDPILGLVVEKENQGD
jgi:CRISPR-associated endonuclease/helicase Cas3